ncbi:hypothetical protein M9Y10_028667 [Tritrichomonas musculus]|uniref:Raptor N-terminal CASPase-like domain-containing protein n=1 Tax=Tritrichomonas musculus TaxID=1915356 RepID=A0ABR2KJY3_9EUKA
MSTESSSSKEDMPFPHDRSNSSSNCFMTLKRAPRVPLYDDDDHYLQNENEEIENQNVDYPVCNYIDLFYKDFRNRNRIQYKNTNNYAYMQSNENKINEFCNNPNFSLNNSFCYSTPNVPTETIQIPKQINLRIGKVIVLLADLSALNLNGKKVQSKYIHSWKNISKIATVEANKFLEKFFTERYQKIVNIQHEMLHTKDNISIASARSKSANIYQIGTQYLAQNPTINITTSKQPRITSNSSAFGVVYPSPQPSVKIIVNWTNDISRGFFSKNCQISSNNTIRIFHYVGLGLSPPTEDSLYTLDFKDQKPTKMLISELNLSPPSLSIFDCDKAAILLDYFKNYDANTNGNSEKGLFSAFFATSKSEQLRIPSDMPQNLFSCILLSPKDAFSKITNINVKDKELFNELLTIFTESIGLDSLPTETFYSIFRGDPVVSTLWQNFFLAQRLMHKYGLQSQSYPELRDMSEHQLWYQFEYAMMSSATFSNEFNHSKKQTKSNTVSSTSRDNDIHSSAFNLNNTINDSSNDEYEPDYETGGYVPNFVNEVRRMNTFNYTNSVFLSPNPIYNLSNMYCISFDTLENPPSYVTAFIASLIIIPNLRKDIMARIARFMSKSPQNCVTMGKVLNYSILCQLYQGLDCNEDLYVDWCCVMSGFLLAVPSLASFFSMTIESNRFIKICLRITRNNAKNNARDNDNRNSNSNLNSDLSFDSNINNSNNNISLEKNMKIVRSLGISKNVNNFDVSQEDSLAVYDTFKTYSDAICVYLLSILVAVRDCPSSPICLINSELIKQFLPCIFTSSPILREWMVIFFHSAFTRNKIYLDVIGPMGFQSLTALLLFEKRKFTRAAAITVLISIMNEKNIIFNHTVMNSALKAAIDGSHIVRHTFLLFAAYYLQLSNRKLLEEGDDDYEINNDNNDNDNNNNYPPFYNENKNDDDDDDDIDEDSNDSSNGNYNEFTYATSNQYHKSYVKTNNEDKIINKILDDFIKNDNEKFNENSNMFQGQPKLKRLIKFLQNDPYPENRKLATEILNNEYSTPPLTRCQNYAVQIHRMAHTLLFSSQTDEKFAIRQRYCDNFFEDNISEMFELVDTESGPIHTIAFDLDHKTFCTASKKGEIVWGENRWKIGDNILIESICPLRGLAWAAISNEGIVYILRDGQKEPVDEFRPSMREIHRPNIDSNNNITVNEFSSAQQSNESNINNSFDNKQDVECATGVLCSSPDTPILFISQGNNEILAWDIEALLLVGRIDVEAPPKFMTMINGKLYVGLVNGVILQIGIKNGSFDKQLINTTNQVQSASADASASNSETASQSPSISSFTQQQNDNNFSDNDIDEYIYDEIDESEDKDVLSEEIYSSGDELFLYVRKRNEIFKNKNLLRIGNHKGLLFTMLDKGPLYFWENFEFPMQINDEMDKAQADFMVHPLYPIALLLNDSPLLIQVYEDAPFPLTTNRTHKCTCCCFDGDRPLCAIGYDDGSVAVWRIGKPDNNTINEQ